MDHSTRATSAPQTQRPIAPASAARRAARTRGWIATTLAAASLLLAAHARAGGGGAATAPEPVAGDTLTLRDALLRALRESPLLPASALELRAREAETLQAGLLPNPSLTTEVEDFGGGGGARNGFDASQTTVSLAQLIELGGKRAARVRLADADADLARWDFESLRMDVLSGVAKAFLATLAAQEKLLLTEELRRIARSSVATVTRTVESGAVSPVEEGRARVLLSQVEIEREQRARDLAQTRLALAASWGSAEPAFGDVAGRFDTVREPEALAQLWGAVERNPDLARWTSEIEQRAATLSLAEARSVPDLTVSAGGR